MIKNKHEEILFESINSSIKNILLNHCNDQDIDNILDKIPRDSDYIKSVCLLPYWFFKCFENKNNIEIESELFILGKANLQAYIAYNLYDCIRDKNLDKEHTHLYISIANILIKKSMHDFYQLIDNEKNKINIIDNLFNDKDKYHIDKTIISDIHYHFKYMTDNIHKRSMIMIIAPIIIIWLMGYKTKSNNYIETLNFFINYLNAEQLSIDDDNICDDILNNIYTPATFLMKAKYSSDYIHTMIRSRIEFFMNNAIDSLKKIHFFDFNKFMKLYIKNH